MQKENIPQFEVDEFNSKNTKASQSLISFHDILQDHHTQMADHHRNAKQEVQAW